MTYHPNMEEAGEWAKAMPTEFPSQAHTHTPEHVEGLQAALAKVDSNAAKVATLVTDVAALKVKGPL